MERKKGWQKSQPHLRFLIANKLSPIPYTDDGHILIFVICILLNIHLFDESHVYHYCFWHRFPIFFSLYYEITRIALALDIIKWNAEKWNYIDRYVLYVSFSIWVVGMIIHNHILPFFEMIAYSLIKPYYKKMYERRKQAKSNNDDAK